ncbi:MAG: peptidylprolyl isomerase [candidate division Zixibacteria bacterium]
MKKILFALLPVLTVACLFGSSNFIKPDAEIALVDGRAIAYAEIDSVMEEIRRNSTYGVPSDSIRDAALDSLVFRKLTDIRIDSVSNSLDTEWEFGQSRKGNIAEVAKKVLFNKQISGRVNIDSARIEESYQNSKDELVEQESVKASHILIRRANPDTADVQSETKKKKLLEHADHEAKTAAEAVLKMVLEGRDWDSLASAYSDDKSNASKGGDLGYFFRGRMVPEFDSVVFSSEPGQIKGPISTKFGYHIIRIDDYKPERQRPLDEELRKELNAKLSREDEKKFAQAFIDSLKEAGQYGYNEEVLAGDDKFPGDTWVMSVNSIDTLYFKVYIESLPKYMRWKQIDTVTVEGKRDMLTFLSNGLLLISAARSLGYYDDPEVATAYNDFNYREAKKRMDRLLKDSEYEPSNEEIEEYFYANIKDYTFERPLRVHHIIFEDLAFASVIRDSILAGADFIEMAKRYYPGEPEIREVAYNLDYIGPEDMGHDFFAAANALDIGKLSEPVKTQWGYHIIKLMSKKEDKTVKQVRPGIKHKLKNARNEKYKLSVLQQWKAAADIRVNEELYSKIKVPERKIINVEQSEG